MDWLRILNGEVVHRTTANRSGYVAGRYKGSAWKTRAPFLIKGKWKWIVWTTKADDPSFAPGEVGNKHAVILKKARELNAEAWDFGQADHMQADRANYAGRGGASRKRTLSSISAMRRLPVIFLTEHEAHGGEPARIDLVISQPGAAQIAQRLQDEGIPSYGSDWDWSGDVAGTHVYIQSDSDRDQLIQELKPFAKIEFADYGVPRGVQSKFGIVASKRSQRVRRAAKRGLSLKRL
jgi:hypothetical protein